MVIHFSPFSIPWSHQERRSMADGGQAVESVLPGAVPGVSPSQKNSETPMVEGESGATNWKQMTRWWFQIFFIFNPT